MGRKKKAKETYPVSKDKPDILYMKHKKSFVEPKIETPIEPPVIKVPGITINKYLTNYSQKRNLDTVFVKWFMRKDSSNPLKSVSEWGKLIDDFMNEVV